MRCRSTAAQSIYLCDAKKKGRKPAEEKKRNGRGEKKREDGATPLRDHIIHDYLARFVSQNLDSHHFHSIHVHIDASKYQKADLARNVVTKRQYAPNHIHTKRKGKSKGKGKGERRTSEKVKR